MGRPKRYQYPGAIHHVMALGNHGNDIFVEDADYKRFINLIINLWKRFDFIIFAFALMPDHFHLLIQQGDIDIAPAGAQQVGATDTETTIPHGDDDPQIRSGQFNTGGVGQGATV